MTLFQKLNDLVLLGYKTSFHSEARNLVIGITKTIDNMEYSKESWLPLEDHFYENRVIECIDFMVDEIRKSN